MAKQTKPKKMGRPKLPKGAPRGRIVPIRFVGSGASRKNRSRRQRASQKTVSEWIRGAITMAIGAQ